jgi:hypothetical protein
MALNKQESKIVSAIANTGIAAGEAIWLGVVKAVAKAYGGRDEGEFAREVFKAALPKFKMAIAQRFKACGLNVTYDGPQGVNSMIGGALDYSKQDAAIKKAKATPVVELADAGVAPKKAKTPKELKGFAKDRAQKAIGALITRMKESDPDGAAYLNNAFATWDVKSHLDPIAQCAPTESEIADMVAFLTMTRMERAMQGADDEFEQVEELQKAA